MIRIVQSSNRAEVEALLSPSVVRDRATERAAARIVARVRAEGDAAVRRFARSLDGWSGPIEVSRRQIDAGARQAPAAVRAALKQAARAIRVVAEAQRPREWRVSPAPGVTVSQRVIPLDRVGCYVPGGRYPLPSSLLMTAIPARVAGVPEVVVCSPSVRSGGARRGRRGRRRPRLPARRRPRGGGHGLRDGDGAARRARLSDPATAGCRPPRRWSRRIARSTSTPGRPRS